MLYVGSADAFSRRFKTDKGRTYMHAGQLMCKQLLINLDSKVEEEEGSCKNHHGESIE